MCSTGARTILAAMHEHGVRRLVVFSSAMVNTRQPTGSIVVRRIVQPLLRGVVGRTLYADMRAMEQVVLASGLDWTIIRPSGLCDTEGVTDYLIRENFDDHRFTARADVAAAMLAVLNRDQFVGAVAAVVSPSVNPGMLEVIRREALSKPRC